MCKKNEKEKKESYFFEIWGLLMHLIVLWGVLDANFHSPVMKNLTPVPPVNAEAPAKRLFLFVADGLRFRTFSEEPAVFIKNMMETKGSWGVSHTRMPTESRPGNVAIAAGLYEDPSALFKGWKENPVDFDSVFNQSSFTWAWGSPDIIPMFVKGSRRNVVGDSYPHEWQDFDKSPIRLDSWVFDKYFEWLENEAESVKNESGVIIFFHLLGCDTAGHSSKPHSKEYRDNLKYVDERIKEVVKSSEDYFNDNKTAYIFTADHGMTDWGSHGSGSNDETETPIVVWGAGINHNENQRHDIEQADIAPLISSLLGIPIPVNNEGIVPKVFLKSWNTKLGVELLLNNIKQLLIQIEANRFLACGRGSTVLNWREKQLKIMIDDIKQLLIDNEIDKAVTVSEDALIKCKEYLYYYRQYQRNQLIIYLLLMWAGWIVLLITKLIGSDNNHQVQQQYKFNIVNIIFIIGLIVLLIEHNVSGRNNWRVLIYGGIALISLWLACFNAFIFAQSLNIRELCKSEIIAISGISLLLISMLAGLFNKLYFTFSMIITAISQILLIKNTKKYLLLSTALILAVYPTLPTVKPHPQAFTLLISLVLAGTMLIKQSKLFVLMESIRLIVTGLIITEYINGRNGISWIILITTPISICCYPIDNLKNRFIGVTLGLFCPLILLSASYEPQVYLLLAVHLLALIDVKKDENCAIKRSLTLDDLTTATYFMLYILLSFFGTGNMASISSFDPMWTRHFITIFSPFTMSGLILLKLGIPLILIGCASRIITTTTTSSSIFLAVLLLGDCLSLPLILTVTSQGSWLDIGTAISRFTIAITLPSLFFVLYYLSNPLMTFNIKKLKSKLMKKKHLV